MNKTDFYQQHLNAISRSFAFCIEELESPLREQIGLSYILCRLVDTVEDACWSDKKSQFIGFERFLNFVRDMPEKYEVEDWVKAFPASIPEGEKELLKESYTFFADLHNLPAPVQATLKCNILNMVRGMAHFCGQASEGKNIAIKSLQEANQYCFFVAGVVGELLTQLAELNIKNFYATEHSYLRSAHFGLFLQKINLLKDQKTDLTEGRMLVPNRLDLRESLITHAVPALNYLFEIPEERADFRIFCAWSLYLGLASLPYIDRGEKIPRLEALSLLGEVKLNITDETWLRRRFSDFLPNLGGGVPVTLESSPWLDEIYLGALKPWHFAALGIAKTAPKAQKRQLDAAHR